MIIALATNIVAGGTLAAYIAHIKFVIEKSGD
jgi:hypothetical protein